MFRRAQLQIRLSPTQDASRRSLHQSDMHDGSFGTAVSVEQMLKPMPAACTKAGHCALLYAQPQAASDAVPAAEVSAGDVCAKARLRTQSRCPVRRQQREKLPPSGGATSSVIAASTPPSASSSLPATGH